MTGDNLSDFYNTQERLAYQPKEIFSKKRLGLKKLISFDDRFQEVTKVLSGIISGFPNQTIKILDIGVGDAVYESLLPSTLRKRCQFYGVDISSTQIKRAKKYLTVGKVVDLNNQKLPFIKNYFDIIIISEILEHVFFPDRIIKEADRVLKSGGYILLTYPNSGALQIRLSILFTGRSVMLNYPQNKQHIRFFTSSDILQMLGNDYQIIKHQGLSSFLFEKFSFFYKIKTPRILEIIGNKYLKNLALGNLLLVQKIIRTQNEV